MNYATRVGIVGGGQLGKMLAVAAKKMGMYVVIVDPTPHSPGGQVADVQIVGDYKDEKAIKKLAKLVDVITFEIELANDAVLLDLMKKGLQVHPSPQTLSIIRDKFLQKEFLFKHDIPAAEFMEINSLKDIDTAIKKYKFPVMLKAKTGAYDGRGNFLIESKKDIKKGIEKLRGRALYVEKFVPFVKELAVMVARTPEGKIKMYPVVETINWDNICDTVIAPATISAKARKNTEALVEKVMKNFTGAGIFGVEMFLLKDDSVLVNEIAPRVHNSGHYTIESCVTSQFEQHIRAITGLPLGETDLLVKTSVMKNILAEHAGDGVFSGLEKALTLPGVSVHIYGKKEARIARKMGHIVVVGNSTDECLRIANKARKTLSI